MITKTNIGQILSAEPFNFQEVNGTYIHHYGTSDEGFNLSYNFKAGTFNYPNGVEADRATTQDNHQKESFVVFLCVAQLFSIGYLPKHIKLEGKIIPGQTRAIVIFWSRIMMEKSISSLNVKRLNLQKGR